MNINLFFYLGLTFIDIRELDAVRCKEWRIIPGLSLLNDKLGFVVFTLAHIPIFYFLFNALINNYNIDDLICYLDLFFILYLLLHLLFLKNPKNEFKDWISWLFIIGSAVFGTLDLTVYKI